MLLAVVLGTAALAACGSDDSSDGRRLGEGRRPASAGFPRTLKTAMGDVKIPSQPKRVVVLDTGELDDVTLLGIDPVGAVAPHFKTEGGFPTYLKGEFERHRRTSARCWSRTWRRSPRSSPT